MIFNYYPAPLQHNARFELNKDFNFASAHFIPHESAGICSKIHGHTYIANITVIGNELDVSGMLVNFQIIKELIAKRYDHKLLNDFVEFNSSHQESAVPSTEGVAEAIWKILNTEFKKMHNKPFCAQILLRETPTSYVIFRPHFPHEKNGTFQLKFC